MPLSPMTMIAIVAAIAAVALGCNIGPYRNRPDRRKAQIVPAYNALAVLTYEVAQADDHLFEFTFPAPALLSVDDISDIDPADIGLHGWNTGGPEAIVFDSIQLSEDGLTLTIETVNAMGSQSYCWFDQQNPGIRGPNGEVIDTTPHIVLD